MTFGVRSQMRPRSLSFSPGSRREYGWATESLQSMGGQALEQWLYSSPLDPGIRLSALGPAFQKPHMSPLCGERVLWGYGEVPPPVFIKPRSGRGGYPGSWTSLPICLNHLLDPVHVPLCICLCCRCSIRGQEEGTQRAALCQGCGRSLDMQVGVLANCV